MVDVSIVVPRLDEKPWGGRSLAQFGFELPARRQIGEALVTANDTRVTDGFGAGQTLSDIVESQPASRLGVLAHAAVSGKAVFPLLVKLIDAAENLSIQVHPDDREAEPLDRLGKTEAWHVLAAAPGAKLYVGLKPHVSLEQFAAAARALDGSSSALLRAMDAQPGTTILIPAGTIHALGAGVLVYEIQQPSDVTFRIDDWGRVDVEGNPRAMHFDQGFAVAKPAYRPEYISPVSVSTTIGRRQLLVAIRYFGLERIELAKGARLDLSCHPSPQVVTVLNGDMVLRGDRGWTLEAGHSAVIWPADDGSVEIEAPGPVVALRAWVPDLSKDVVEVARAAGGDDASISGLGGELDDVRNAMQ